MDLFRANSLFRNFEIKGPADRTLIVLILFVSDCLAKIGAARAVPTQIEASKSLNTLSVDSFPIPGDANFPLNAHYAAPTSRMDAGAEVTYQEDAKPLTSSQITFVNTSHKFDRSFQQDSSSVCTLMAPASLANGGCLSRRGAS
jgi:actin related protein 2/3 complex, subunit 3